MRQVRIRSRAEQLELSGGDKAMKRLKERIWKLAIVASPLAILIAEVAPRTFSR